MLKDLLVHLSIAEGAGVEADYAVSLAHAFDAHLTGIAFAYEPVVVGSVFGSIAAEIIDSQRRQNHEAAKKVSGRFSEAARKAGVRGDGRVLQAGVAQAGRNFGRLARRFDCAVLRQPSADDSQSDRPLIEEVLFNSGRPVLLVPYVHKAAFKLERALVCWDGGRTAAIALTAARPLLYRATQIDVLTVVTDAGDRDRLAAADIGQHLAQHGLKPTVHEVHAPDMDVANTILSFTAARGSDLVVMGGYGHWRVREFVLGGATAEMLRSMTVPTLMAH